MLAAAMAIALAGVITWVSVRSEPPEPVYDGKPLSYWLQGYDPQASSGSNSNRLSWMDTEAALKGMGPEAVPYLMKLLRHSGSGVKEWLWGLLQRQSFVRVKTLPRNPRWSALRALQVLGPVASNAVPSLIKMFKTDPSPFGQSAPLTILAHIGPPAKDAVPVLLQQGITHTNWLVRDNAIFALRQIKPEARLVVPEFIKCLSDADPDVQAQAIFGLGDYGNEARAAVPQLLALYQSSPSAGKASMPANGGTTSSIWVASSAGVGTAPPANLKKAAGVTLLLIDHEAAAKAGVTAPDD
jgi:hypothetical protein